MRFLFFLPLLLVGCAQAPLNPSANSTGCQNLNNAFYDDAYLSGNVYFSPFRMGESVSVRLANPDTTPDTTTAIYLIVTDTSGEARADLVTQRAQRSESLSYTFSQDREEMEVYWSADAGVPRWEVTCY